MVTLDAFLIDPVSKTVTPVKVQADDRENLLYEYYRLIGCNLIDYVDCSCFGAPDDGFFIDDEGLLVPNDLFTWDGIDYQSFAGKALFVGTDEQGLTASPKLTLKQLCAKVGFVERKSNPLTDARIEVQFVDFIK